MRRILGRAAAAALPAWVGLAGCGDAGLEPGPDGMPGVPSASASAAANGAGVCGRTPQVRDALAAAVGKQDCASVTAPDLAGVVVLELNGKSISALRAGDLQGLSGLQYLYLSGNQLLALPPGLFSDAPGLAVLDLSDNGFGDLPAGVFGSLARLGNLSLAGNRIARPSASLFTGLRSLETLDLAANAISALPDDVFRDLAGLRDLHLAVNELGSWPGGALRGLARLEALNVRGNLLAEMPAGAFTGQRALRRLALSQNRLRSLPPGLLRGLAALQSLDLADNQLASLPDSFFVGVGGLSSLSLRDNPGSPFGVRVELERTDADDNSAPGPAQIRATTPLGAPFAMDVRLRASGGNLSASSVRIEGGRAASDVVTASNVAGSSFSVAPAGPSVPRTLCSGLPCYEGLHVDNGLPIVLANPPTATLTVPLAYLVQAAQSRAGEVPLVAGRRALLRVFARADSANAFRPLARATFYRDGTEAHVATLAPPPAGVPRVFREGDLSASFNAEVPGRVLQPGTEMVVELDPRRELPLAAGSVRRVPAQGRTSLDVRPVASLDLAVVPVQYVWTANAATNGRVATTARSFVGAESSARLRFVEALLPVADVNVRVRDSYFTWADTTELGPVDLLMDLQLLRHVEAGGTRELYHGVFAAPRFAHVLGPWEFLGVAFQPGHVGMSRSHFDDGAIDPEFESTMAHEVGHNLNLGHAPCGRPFGVDENFPYARASTGVFGYEFAGPGWPAQVLDPSLSVDLMSYCRPYWISDYNFVKALDYRTAVASASASADRPPLRIRSLVLRGAARDGALHLAAPFAWDAPPKLPAASGPYRLVGADRTGAELFAFAFAPDEIDHGGRGFLFALPMRAAWRDALHSVTVHGPEGRATREIAASAGLAVFTDPATGRIRGIARNWSGTLPPALRAAGPVEVAPGWPSPNGR